MKSIFLIVLGVFLVGLLSPLALASKPINIPFGHNQVQHLPSIGLSETSVDGRAVTTGEGLEGFKKIVNVVLSSAGFILRTVAIFVLFVAGFILVTAQNSASEQIEKQKMTVIYTIVGLVSFGLGGDFIYNYFFREQGAYIFQEGSAVAVASELGLRIKELLNLFLSFSGAGAILMLVVAGIRTLFSPGSDEEMEHQKKIVGYTAVGIIIIGLADVLVNQIVFPSGGYEGVNISALEAQLKGLSNYLLGFLGVAVFVTFVISGVVMVVNLGNDDLVSKAKTAMKSAVLGSLIAFSAYTIVATIIRTFLAA